MGSYESSDAKLKCPLCQKHHPESNSFMIFGTILRLPLFTALVILKIVIAFPFELIIFKIIMGCGLFVVSLLGIAKAILFSDTYNYKENVDTIKEISEGFFDFEAFDFSRTVHFLRYGNFGWT